MSKINQIQNAIKELDGGAFQKLADSYLKKKGYDYLVPLGSVIGANKVRKGTPDTLVILPSTFLPSTLRSKLDSLKKFRATSINALMRQKQAFPYLKSRRWFSAIHPASMRVNWIS
jgi:hypothetical protein